MPIIDLVPNSELIFNPSFWSVVGATSSTVALADDDNTSYIQTTTFAGAPGAQWDLSSATLAANQRVSAVRLRLGVLQGNGRITFNAYESLTFNVRATRQNIAGPGCIQPPQDCDQWASAIVYSGWWPGVAPGFPSGEINQAHLDSLRFDIEITDGPGVFQLSSMALEVDIRTQPTVAVNPGFGSPVSTLVSWVPVLNDGDVQTKFEVAIFSEAQYTAGGFNPSSTAATYRITGSGTATSAPVAAALVPGVNYRAYVRVAKAINYGTTTVVAASSQVPVQWYSDWSFAAIVVSDVATTNYIGPVSEGQLSCHNWIVALQERGGGKILAEVPWSEFTWGRMLEDASSASVSFPYAACTTNRDLAEAREWTHEIGIWRDSSSGVVEEWVGPITNRQVTRKGMTWQAKDLFAWMEHRRVHGDYTLVGIDLVTIFVAWVLDALGPDNSMGMDVSARASGVVGDRTVLANQRRRAADLLRDLARSGVSFTQVARTLLVSGAQLPIDALARLLDEHTSDPQQSFDGSSAATDVAVLGKLKDDVQILGSASISGSLRGVLESTVSASEIEDSGLADDVAASNLAVLQNVPEVLRLPLKAECQNGYAALIPGAQWLLDLPSIAVFGTYQLRQLQVQVTRQESAVKEDVTATAQTLDAELIDS